MTPPIPAKDCADMHTLRQQIDAIDVTLVRLLADRAGYIDRAVELKTLNGWPANIPARVEDVVAKVRSTAKETGLDAALVESLWRQLITWSIAREAQTIREN